VKRSVAIVINSQFEQESASPTVKVRENEQADGYILTVKVGKKELEQRRAFYIV
jgi:hypothetical protein